MSGKKNVIRADGITPRRGSRVDFKNP